MVIVVSIVIIINAIIIKVVRVVIKILVVEPEVATQFIHLVPLARGV